MGLKEDLERYRKVGEERRQDLKNFIQYGEIGKSDKTDIRIPIKIVQLPEFVYDDKDKGGVGQSEKEKPEVGDIIQKPQKGEDEGEGGSQEGDHGYYEMDPEEFAEEIDEEFELNLEPKGKKVKEEITQLTDITKTGPESVLDLERTFKQGLKRKLATAFDPDYIKEILKVDGKNPQEAFRWARKNRMNVSKKWLKRAYKDLSVQERKKWSSIDEVKQEFGQPNIIVRNITFRDEDQRYRYPETIEKEEEKVVVVNIRDISGSMDKEKRELVERVFSPLDWYLQGKYEQADFIYIVHDYKAWKVEREEFFGIESGGGTRISSAYELTKEILKAEYPWNGWNRFVFASGDGENYRGDSKERVIPLIEDIEANLHGYVETQPTNPVGPTHSRKLEKHFNEKDNVVVTEVNSNNEVVDSIKKVLRAAGSGSNG